MEKHLDLAANLSEDGPGARWTERRLDELVISEGFQMSFCNLKAVAWDEDESEMSCIYRANGPGLFGPHDTSTYSMIHDLPDPRETPQERRNSRTQNEDDLSTPRYNSQYLSVYVVRNV